MRSTIAAGLACLVLAGCSRAPLTYGISPEEAYARLEKADIAGFRLARQCGILIYLTSQRTPGKAIRWIVTSSGQTVASFQVRLLPEDDGTRAVIEIPADPRGGEIYDGVKEYPRPALNQPLRPAIEELVNAAMEGRHFRTDGLDNSDRVCSIQRSGLESGAFRFSVDDDPGKDSRMTARDRADTERNANPNDYGAPMDRTPGD